MIFLLSIGLTTTIISLLIYRFCLAHHFLLDTPNHRSSHHQPTPKAGGIGLIIVYAIYTTFQYTQGVFNLTEYLVLQTPVLLGLLGLIDDYKPSTIKARLFWQTIIMAGLLVALPLPNLWVGAIFFMGMIYFINLYNFMDGIDGLVTTYSISLLINLTILLAFSNPLTQHLLLPALALLLGFIPFNRSKAKLFLGNSGSYFLGGILIVISLQLITKNSIQWPTLLVAISLFCTETTVILIVRTLKGHPIGQAHCTHIYQIISQTILKKLVKIHWKTEKSRQYAHNIVTSGYVLLNTALLPVMCYMNTKYTLIQCLILLAIITIEVIIVLVLYNKLTQPTC